MTDKRYRVTIVAVGERDFDAKSMEAAKELAHADHANLISYVIVEDLETNERRRYER